MRTVPAVAPTDLRNAGVVPAGQLMVVLIMVFTAGPILSLTVEERAEAVGRTLSLVGGRDEDLRMALAAPYPRNVFTLETRAEASMIRLIAAVTLALFLMTQVTVRAQEMAPRDVLPPVSVFQGEWTLRSVSFTQPDPSVIAQLVSGTYLGPEGSRATVLIVRAQDGPLAAQKAQRFIGRAFDNTRNSFVAKSGVERDLAKLPIVTGCADMRRATGVDTEIPDIAVGLSLCAANSTTLVLTYVSGSLNGLSGYEASDALVALVLNAAAEATPIASLATRAN